MKKVCENSKNRAKIDAVERLNAFHALHLEISREQGQITALQDEIEKKARSNLDRIKDLRYSVKTKQQEMKKLAESLGIEINQLLFQ